LEELLSYLIYSASTRAYCDKIEMKAAIDKASEVTNINMSEYLKRYEEDLGNVKIAS
jgi:hypothetical protein